MENTGTFLVVFHMWDDGKKSNLRMRIKKEDFETCAYVDEEIGEDWVQIYTCPYFVLGHPQTDAYLSWAPSHSEFCLLTEVLTYANLINGLKPEEKQKIKPHLIGKVTRSNQDQITYFKIHADLLKHMETGTMVSFANRQGISFKICYEYIEYIRKLVKPYII